MARRSLLVLGVIGMGVSSAEFAGAGTTGELEGGVYGGSASGRWACGPSARVNYAGAGVRGRVWLSDKERARLEASARRSTPAVGFSVGGGVAGESRSYGFLSCNRDPCEPQDRLLPPTGLLGAATLSLGYDAPWVGFRAGILAFQGYPTHDEGQPRLLALPELGLRVGKRQEIHGELGLGSYSIDTMLRPGLYLGGSFPLGDAVDLVPRLGVHRVFDDGLGFRADLGGRVHVAPSWRLDLGVGSSSGMGRLNPHGRFAAALDF